VRPTIGLRHAARSAVLGTLLALLAAAGALAEARVIALAIRDGRLPERERVVRVTQGDEVTLRWTTDRPVTLHLHGYDIEATLGPAAPAVMRFTARATGRFPIEIHGGAARPPATVAHLEVHPR
jgi:hypothetical protein